MLRFTAVYDLYGWCFLLLLSRNIKTEAASFHPRWTCIHTNRKLKIHSFNQPLLKNVTKLILMCSCASSLTVTLLLWGSYWYVYQELLLSLFWSVSDTHTFLIRHAATQRRHLCMAPCIHLPAWKDEGKLGCNYSLVKLIGERERVCVCVCAFVGLNMFVCGIQMCVFPCLCVQCVCSSVVSVWFLWSNNRGGLGWGISSFLWT